jgi:hypothetical protein
MKAYRHLIRTALRHNLLISVDTGGDELDLKRSDNFRLICEAVEAVDEAHMYLSKDGKRFANVFVIAFGLADDETVVDWQAANDQADEWLSAWNDAYTDHQARAERLMR